ncbi:molecular chaperone HtpG [Acidocella aminolytica]|jgi:molecular chaperone HtpG|uniref:Chaperone protein HtpG n=1 Tax=Acidocella aminolytica 101 = DSM 11237 TaxID=1120923 RepID=A0A0D6PEZ6_9PROT|nr:molecular chaperone HtpG [Acidocella aminolytica]GAN79936.1 heat shock protein HtpG/Hsp90 [Acidocella aminolytica 101 = DSM 11237]GBQ36849.1 heat shock protein 90 [Acidocella aminolytica 101 = DSM 11237]SHE58972.1 molecular chaperone HtpG [Acidocella aminolytica 101 = DSM 11237]
MTEETRRFGTEVGRLLDLVVHSLYSDREIFLRELVANAADATDKRRFMALSDGALALPDNAAIRISADKAARTIRIEDNGIGMSKEELAENLGTIARSGTAAFTSQLASAKPEDRPSLIGQFGVGFYSAFMVAEKVEVTSRKAGHEEAWEWVSDGQGEYTLKSAARGAPGTTILLHIKPDAEEYLEPIRLKTIIRKWADHITWPVEIEEDGKFEAATEGKALWRKNRSEITPEEYADFYRHVGHNFDEPFATIHWRAEGTVEFNALLFIPSQKPFMPVEESRESKVRLHVKRMFITDDAKLLPNWLNFVVGVVDTEDLPLNVSREILQSTPVLEKIRKVLVNRVLSELKAKAKDAEAFKAFLENFGSVMKEGIYEDTGHAAEIAALLRFASTKEDATTLDDYIARMPEGQSDIYYLAGDAAHLKTSPQLEGFAEKGYEVLLLGDAIDAFWPGRLGSYKEKKLVSVSQAGNLFAAGDVPEAITNLCTKLKEALGEDISEVTASSRLKDSPAMLVAAEAGPDLAMQRLLRRAGRPVFGLPPKLEINPSHKLVEALAAKEDVKEAASLLLNLAKLQDGDLPENPAEFVKQISAALAENA